LAKLISNKYMIYVIYLSTDFIGFYLSNSESLICYEIRAYVWVS